MLNELAARFPNYDQKLYVVPHPPTLRDDRLVQLQLSHKNVIKLVGPKGLFGRGGFLIQKIPKRKQEKAADSSDEDSFPEISELRDSLDALSDDTTQCCVYCPNLRLDNLLLFKVVSSLNTASVGIMMQSARDQIQGLAKFLSSSQSSKNLQAKFNFIVIWKVPKNSNVEQYSDEIKASVGKIERELVSKFGKVSLTVTEVSMDKKESKFDEAEITKVKNLVNIDSANGFESSQNETLLAQLILKASEKPTLCFTETEFNLHGSNENVKVDEKGMVTFMNFYFPSKTQKLITIPDIDHCKLNQLQYLNENSELISDPNLNVYKGELQLFWPELHKWFNDKPYGLLLHGLKNDILSRVMKRKFPFVFEIDWLLSTEDYLIAFEVGLKTSENPKSIIRNKLNQIFTKIIPTLKLLTWFALVNYDNQAEKKINFILKNLDSFFYKHFRAVVFIGNVESEELKKNLHEMLLAPSNETGLEFESEDLSEDSLRAVYFAGAPKNDDNHFLQIRRESTLEKLVVVETEVKKVVELLKPLDVKTMESVEASSQSIANENTRNILNYVLAAYTLCFFVDEDGSCKLKPAQTEVKDIDVRFSVAPKKQKIEKNETKPNRNKTENILEISRKLTVLVSRQQLSILREDPKFLIIRGEPGSGKTVLLLAKAKQAAMSPDVHKIYFYIPSPKLKLKSFVMEFVEKHSEDKRFTERFEILDDENLNQILRSKNRKDLKKTVLLMDEFYFGTDKSLENREREIFGLSIEIFPYLKNCWIACVALCFFGKFTQFLPNYLPIEMFCIKPLNIQFRASEHIAKFCTNIVHKGEIKGFSSCRVPGVYTSSQVKIEPKVFKDKNDINFGSLQEKFIKRRWAVVYCDPEKKRQWLEFLKRDAKFHDFEEKFVVSITEGPAHCDFSGGECFSLVLIIDKIDTPDTDRDKLMEEAIYTLAMSRAQYEIEIFVHESMKLLIEQWGKYCVMDTVEKPGIAREIYLASLGDDKKAKCNYKRLTKTHLTNLGQFVNGDQKKFVLVFLGRGLAIRILNFLLALSSRVQNQQNDDDFYQKKEYHDAIKDVVIHAIQVNHRPTVDWIFQIMSFSKMTHALSNYLAKIMSYVCFKPDLMDICLKHLPKEVIGSRVSLWKGWRAKKSKGAPSCGLIPILCFANVDLNQKCISNTLDILPEYLARTALDEFYGKDALQHSLDHGNEGNVTKLVCQPKWRKIFQSKNEIYGTEWGYLSMEELIALFNSRLLAENNSSLD